jgi:aminocarboxymuconate-semialdehyde decarboxylase
MWDVHAHVVPPTVVRAAEAGWFGLQADGRWLLVDGERVPLEPLTDIEALKSYATSQGMSLVLSVPPAFFRPHYSDGDLWCRFVNDAMAEVREQVGNSSEITAILPLAAPDQALAEWARVSGKVVGITMGASVGDRLLSDNSLRPVWQALSVKDVLVLVHGGHHADPRLKHHYLDNLLGYPYEDGLAVASLVFSDLPLTCPKIHWCISHGGGAAPFVVGRWQRGYDTGRPGIDKTLPSPHESLRRLWLDSVVHDMRLLQWLMDELPGRVVLGTDYPFPMGIHDDVTARRLPLTILNRLAENGTQLMNLVRKGRAEA